jgi:hypothetical protein
MPRTRIALALTIAAIAPLGACRDYDALRHVSNEQGLIPADKYARYGREQAIVVAIGREFARPYNSGPEAQAEVAIAYARNRFSKDIVDISADPLGNRLVVTFRSGWRTAIMPVNDGRTGDATKIPS